MAQVSLSYSMHCTPHTCHKHLPWIPCQNPLQLSKLSPCTIHFHPLPNPTLSKHTIFRRSMISCMLISSPSHTLSHALHTNASTFVLSEPFRLKQHLWIQPLQPPHCTNLLLISFPQTAHVHPLPCALDITRYYHLCFADVFLQPLCLHAFIPSQ